MNTPKAKFNRRNLLKLMSLGATSIAAPQLSYASNNIRHKDPKFLIVVAATGGASLIDSFLAIRESEAKEKATTINCFADKNVHSIKNSPLRAVKYQGSIFELPVSTDQLNFVKNITKI